MYPRNNDPRAGKNNLDSIEGEVSAPVVDHEIRPGGLIFALTEAKMHLIKIRPPAGKPLLEAGTILDITSKGGSGQILGTLNYRNLTSAGQNNLAGIIESINSENAEPFISFFNRAGNLSLKMHAFQLLPGIGKKKALEIVDLRGRNGWDDFATMDSSCGIDGKNLLAQRLAQEISDQHEQPRLVDLLLRQE
mgnify:FL=1